MSAMSVYDEGLQGQIGDAEERRVVELRQWINQHDSELREGLIRKAIEYGSSDFDIMGNGLVKLSPPDLSLMNGKADSSTYGEEMAICFYLLGKVARAMGALERGREVSMDTINDIEAYGKIWVKVRETGRWY